MQKVRVTRYYIADFENLRRGPLAKECEQLQETGEHKEINSPPEPPEGNAAQTHLDFSPVTSLPDLTLRTVR